jgi:hypothetical protein
MGANDFYRCHGPAIKEMNSSCEKEASQLPIIFLIRKNGELSVEILPRYCIIKP